ncbi:MAG TPA: flagellar basal body-associated FliL family protein [Fimbriimonadaceae bacterium]|nr:flagellar basal body-associated FliL family protein [Fimbriimonadaceae bacterium]
MSEQAQTTETTKKKSKLPLIIVLAVFLGAGGFFGLKMRGGETKKPEPVKLGAVVEIKDEFLTNMAERNSYVRTKISLQLKDGFDKVKLEHELAPIQDVINMKLQATSVRTVATLDGLRALKRSIAADLNRLLSESESESDKGKKNDKKGKKDSKKPEIPAGWDSAEGPVLKVLFVSFATQ